MVFSFSHFERVIVLPVLFVSVSNSLAEISQLLCSLSFPFIFASSPKCLFLSYNSSRTYLARRLQALGNFLLGIARDIRKSCPSPPAKTIINRDDNPCSNHDLKQRRQVDEWTWMPSHFPLSIQQFDVLSTFSPHVQYSIK